MSDGGAFEDTSEEEDTSDTINEEESTGTSGESAELDPDERYRLRLIKEVRKRPPLWNTGSRNYFSRPLKDEKWQEVVSKLHDKTWSGLNGKEKQRRVKKAQATWKNMKDCFIRYLNKVQKGEKRKRYRYYKQLQFLQTIVENSKRKTFRALKRESFEDNTKSTHDSRGSKRSSKRLRNELASNQVSSGTTSARRDATPSRQPSNNLAPRQKSVGTSTRDDASSSHSNNDPACHKLTTPGIYVVRKDESPGASSSEFATGRQMMLLEAAQLELLRAKQEKEPDEDRDFASSLVPMLRELDYDRKYQAKTKILSAMKMARYFVLDPSVDLPALAETTCSRPHADESLTSSPASTSTSQLLPSGAVLNESSPPLFERGNNYETNSGTWLPEGDRGTYLPRNLPETPFLS